MSKIHITLVGGQPAPVYMGVIATQPDKIIFIYSDSKESIKALRAVKSELNIPSDEIKLDVTSPETIKFCAESLVHIYVNDEVTVNISSGLKSWSHWFGVIFDKCPNAAVLYMDQNNTLWNYRTMQASSGYTFDMHTLFRLYGNPIENNYTAFDDYTEEDFTAIEQIEDIRKINIPAFSNLTARLSAEQKEYVKNSTRGHFSYDTLSQVNWDKTLNKVDISILGSEKFQTEIVVSPHAIDLVFNAGWFEVKVAQILSKWDKAKEICLNCHFPSSRKDVDKNEADIIVNTGNKILFVECKTQISKITDIDKFRSVVKGYGGTASKGLFITYHTMTKLAREKCQELGILNFSLEAVPLGKSIEASLYSQLDSNLDKINTK